MSPTAIHTPAPTEAPQPDPTLIPLPDEERPDTDCPCEANDSSHRLQRVVKNPVDDG